MLKFFEFVLSSIELFQVIHQKPKKTLDEISHDLCPVSNSLSESKDIYLLLHHVLNYLLYFILLHIIGSQHTAALSNQYNVLG